MSARSYLFVPASRCDRVPKALASGADAVIVDLEDAVPPDDKDSAREQLDEWLAQATRAQVIVRVNAADTRWFAQDLVLCKQPAVVGVMLPKAERPDDLVHVGRTAVGRPLFPLIETAIGFDHLRLLARTAGVKRLAFGSVDFQHDLGIEGDDQELLHFRSALVLESRLAGLAAPVDGVTIDIDDEGQLSAEAGRARRLGFGAKLCIHPLQIGAVHRAFRADPGDLAWAERVVLAAAGARGAPLTLDGKMVDKPVILRAQTMLARAREDEAASR